MGISREGTGTFVAVLFFTAMLAFFGFMFHNDVMLVISGVGLVVFVFTLYFFRDPQRTPPQAENCIVSPADGRVMEVTTEREKYYLEDNAVRVSIFLSVFDVHINYIPVSGEVEYLKYKRGDYLPAYRAEAGEKNQQMVIGLLTPRGKFVFKQGAGMIARRIVCHLRFGQQVRAGEKFGMIKLGSRVDIYFPSWASVEVEKGDRVRAGETVIGYIHEE